MVSFSGELERWKQAIASEMERARGELYPEDTRLHQACRYALEGEGKRIRPLLVLAAAEAAGGCWQDALPGALAVEWIHTYSLVHDDLPCMDNDDLRRGRPTTHKAYDEATALLVGDALLTDAFTLIAATTLPDASKLAMVQALALAAGGRGMVLGQALDMHWTARQGYRQEDLDRIHELKTGCLIRAACAMGASAAGAPVEQRRHLESFGTCVGLAFQIIDDLLDEQDKTGKTRGKDRDAGKLTYLRLMSPEHAAKRAEALTLVAYQSLEGFGERSQALRDLAALLLHRSL